MVKRLRTLKIHVYILATLKSHMPSMMGKEKKQTKLIDNLGETFREVQQKYDLPTGDFPNLERMQEKLRHYKLDKFPKLDPRVIEKIDDILGVKMPGILEKFGNPFDGGDN